MKNNVEPKEERSILSNLLSIESVLKYHSSKDFFNRTRNWSRLRDQQEKEKGEERIEKKSRIAVFSVGNG